jgi:energy-coupling factor transporter transmembrane protein EcfT
MLNPATLILAWAILVIALQMMKPVILSLALILLLVSAMAYSASGLLSLMRRTRWIMVSLILIYACATPGTPVIAQLAAYSPTSEGLLEGLLQLARLISVLASLAILLARLDQQNLISGLYTLASPLQFLGLRERIAVRLALTLEYAKTAMLDTSADWRGCIEQMLAPLPAGQSAIELPLGRLGWRDGLVFMAASALLLMVLP